MQRPKCVKKLPQNINNIDNTIIDHSRCERDLVCVWALIFNLKTVYSRQKPNILNLAFYFYRCKQREPRSYPVLVFGSGEPLHGLCCFILAPLSKKIWRLKRQYREEGHRLSRLTNLLYRKSTKNNNLTQKCRLRGNSLLDKPWYY